MVWEGRGGASKIAGLGMSSSSNHTEPDGESGWGGTSVEDSAGVRSDRKKEVSFITRLCFMSAPLDSLSATI